METQCLTDQEISDTIMEFCQRTNSAGSSDSAHLTNLEDESMEFEEVMEWDPNAQVLINLNTPEARYLSMAASSSGSINPANVESLGFENTLEKKREKGTESRGTYVQILGGDMQFKESRTVAPIHKTRTNSLLPSNSSHNNFPRSDSSQHKPKQSSTSKISEMASQTDKSATAGSENRGGEATSSTAATLPPPAAVSTAGAQTPTPGARSTARVSADLLGQLLKALRPDLEVSQVLDLLAQPPQSSTLAVPPATDDLTGAAGAEAEPDVRKEALNEKMAVGEKGEVDKEVLVEDRQVVAAGADDNVAIEEVDLEVSDAAKEPEVKKVPSLVEELQKEKEPEKDGGRRRRYHKIVAEEDEEEERSPRVKRPRSAWATRPRDVSPLAVISPPRKILPPPPLTKQRRDEPTTGNKEEQPDKEVDKNALLYRRVFVKVDRELLKETTRFEDPKVKAECDARVARGRTVKSGRALDPPSLVDLGAEEEFVQYITGIGFEWLLEFEKTEVPVVLAQEFFTTFRFQHTSSVIAKDVQFRMFGKTVRMSLTEWSVRLGLYTERQAEAGAWLARDMKQPEEIEDFDPQAFWESITTNAPPYNATTSKATCIKRPVLRLAQVFLGYNLLGQANTTSSITLAELYFMWCMMEQREVHLGYWIAYTCHTIAAHSDRNLNVCHILGKFMRRNFDIVYDSVNPPPLCPSPDVFGIAFFVRIRMVKMVSGRYHFYLVDQSGNTASPSQALAIEAKKFEDEEPQRGPEKKEETEKIGKKPPGKQLALTTQASQAEDQGEASTPADPWNEEVERLLQQLVKNAAAQQKLLEQVLQVVSHHSSGSAPPPKRK